MNEQMNVKLIVAANSFAMRVNALSEHIKNAPAGDPVADMAREIGEIDLAECISASSETTADSVTCDFTPTGDLARLLSAFEAPAQ